MCKQNAATLGARHCRYCYLWVANYSSSSRNCLCWRFCTITNTLWGLLCLCKINSSKFHTSFLLLIGGEVPELSGSQIGFYYSILQNGILGKINCQNAKRFTLVVCWMSMRDCFQENSSFIRICGTYVFVNTLC